MIDKIKKIFENKEKRIENLISLLIILVITLIVINKIMDGDEKENLEIKNEVGVEFAKENVEYNSSTDLEKRLENILSKISGVGDVSVLLTYKETQALVPIYNINSSISTVEEKDTSGGSRITETENLQKDVVTSNSNADIVTEKSIMPIIEGAIITASGADVIDAGVSTAVSLAKSKSCSPWAFSLLNLIVPFLASVVVYDHSASV